MNDKVEIIRSNKGGMKLIHRGYMYTVHKKRQGGGIRWRCTQRSLHCKGSISTGEQEGLPRVNMPHNHIPDPHSVAIARCRQFEEFGELATFLEDQPPHPVDDKYKVQQSATATSNGSDEGLRIEKRVMSIMQFRTASPDISHFLDNDLCDLIPENFHALPLQERISAHVPIAPLQTKSIVVKNASAATKYLPIAPKPVTTPTTPPQQSNGAQQQQQQSNDEKDPDEVCLRWNSHHSNMKTSFPSLLEKEQYVDVTLCSEGQTIRCHKLILSSCSSYFDEILSGITPLQHPVIFLKGTPFWILKSLIDFMYVGEVHIEQSRLQEILEVAEALKIKGLTGKSSSPEPKEEQKVDPKPPESPPQLPTPTQGFRSPPPLKFVGKESSGIVGSIQTVDPQTLLKPSFYEESRNAFSPDYFGLKKVTPSPQIKEKVQQQYAEITLKQKEWLSKKIMPKKKLKRKSTEHEPSPPPIILRKGTKSRPIVKAPKYYHMEYEENDGRQHPKEEVEDEEEMEDEEEPAKTDANNESNFDISTVKTEPIDVVDIEENDVAYNHFPSTGTITFNESTTDEDKEMTNEAGKENKSSADTQKPVEEDKAPDKAADASKSETDDDKSKN